MCDAYEVDMIKWVQKSHNMTTAAAAAESLLSLTKHSVMVTEKLMRHNAHKKATAFKDGWSPRYMGYKVHLLAMLEIERHITGCHGRTKWTTPAVCTMGLQHIVQEWRRRTRLLRLSPSAKEEVQADFDRNPTWWKKRTETPTALLLWCREDMILLKKRMHGRHRTDYRQQLTINTRKREQLRIQGKLRKVLRSLLSGVDLKKKQRIPYAMTELRTEQAGEQEIIVDPEEIHELLTEHFKAWYAAPQLAEGEEDIHTQTLNWQRLSGDQQYFMELTKHTKVPDKYRQLAFEALTVQGAEAVHQHLTNAFAEGPTLEEFVTAISTAPKQSAPGVTGCTYAMMKAWPPQAMKMAHKALSTMWNTKEIPQWWKWRWLVPVPKKKDPSLADLRPLTLVEATRKIWSRLIIMKITRAWDNNDLLNPAQHGFRNKMSTMTATLQYINALEDAKETGRPIHRSSWDMSKAFDTVSKPAMMIAWLRLGVPHNIAEWLVGLDLQGVTIVRTPLARQAWLRANYQGFRAPGNNFSRNMRPMTNNQELCKQIIDTFLAELGTGQVMLDNCDRDPYWCRGAKGNMYTTGETAFADDMESTSATNKGMQEKANVVSAFCLIFGLRISPSKLRRYFQDWSCNVEPTELCPMTVYTTGWTPSTVDIEVDGVTGYLGA
eukprot:gene28247-35072_t